MNGPIYHFIAFWAGRADDARLCGARLAVMLQKLAEAHPAFAQWNEKAYRREDANRPFCAMPPQQEELAAQFARNAMEPVMGRHIGFSVAAWNGREDSYSLAFYVHAGDANDWPPARHFSNLVSMDMPRRSDENADLTGAACMRAILLAAVAAWEPDCAGVSDWKYKNALKDRPGEPLPPFRSGWMTFIGPRYARHVVPPPQAIAEPVAGGGLLMLATREAFDVSNPEHVAAADAIQRALEPIQRVVAQKRPT